MKTKRFIFRMLMAMLVMVGTLPMATSCTEKENNGTENNGGNGGGNPSGNYVQYNGQTYNASTMIHMVEGDEDMPVHIYSIVFGSQNTLSFSSGFVELTNGTYEVYSDAMSAMTNNGIYGVVTTTTNYAFVGGTLTVSRSGNNITVDFDGDKAKAHYSGQLIDYNDNTPTGTGTLTYDGTSYDLNKGYTFSGTEDGVSFQVIDFEGENEDVEISVAFGTLGTFSNGTYSFVEAESPADMTAGTVAGSIDIYNASTEMEMGSEIVSGSMTFAKNGDDYTINANGTDKNGKSFTISYSGSLLEMPFTKALKSLKK